MKKAVPVFDRGFLIGSIMTRTGGIWRQTIYRPLYYVSESKRRTVLRPIVKTPSYDCADYERVPCVNAANGRLSIMLRKQSFNVIRLKVHE